ncbi:HotDog domain-containing protein [Cokeromyces recurvatus]|uniref:HotDog domain-containing protein n=1 Tax=Cokeromyces recurvatus TaxID=90255 RepID=UPI002220DF71|nr:HotDog domain-containing protein [Cokeromyces recurvatus]KAI7902682.1 HotDog domain-containing protein [Cokeromyces recurvatus]
MPEGYKVDISKAVGHTYPPDIVACTRRDYLLYALSVGVPENDLQWLYELDINFGPLPTYPLCLLLKADDWDVNSFIERWSSGGPLPGVPPYDFNKIVHGEQSFEVIQPFPTEGGRFKLIKKCVGVYDKGSGMVIDSRVDLYGEEDDVHYCRMSSKMFIRGYGGWNGPKGPKPVIYDPPLRDPDVIDSFKTAPNQALLYRLSGDFNPLHADIHLASAVGFHKPILHGLCSYGKCAHSIIKYFGDNDRTRFKSMEARFAQPVFPGETIEILMWKVPTTIRHNSATNLDTIIFQARVKERNVFVLTNGYALLYKKDNTFAKI